MTSSARRESVATYRSLLFQDRGTGRQWRLLEYAPTFGGGPGKVSESAIVRLPNPSEFRVGKRAARSLVIQSGPSQVSATSDLKGASYQTPTQTRVAATCGSVSNAYLA